MLALQTSLTEWATALCEGSILISFPGFHFEPWPNDRLALPVAWPFFDSTVLVSRTIPNVAEKNPTPLWNVQGKASEVPAHAVGVNLGADADVGHSGAPPSLTLPYDRDRLKLSLPIAR